MFCRYLKKVVIRQGVSIIEPMVFWYCDKLEKVYLQASIKDMLCESFVDKRLNKRQKLNLTIYTKKNSNAYKAAKKWKKYGIKVKAA